MQLTRKSTLAISLMAVGIAGLSSSAMAQNFVIGSAKVQTTKAMLSSLNTTTSQHAYSASCTCPFCTNISHAGAGSTLDAIANL